jgi:hypothetical protein
MMESTKNALLLSDMALFIIDGKEGLNQDDLFLAK